MATLAVNKPRTYEAQEVSSFNDLPVIASDIIYEGAAVGDNGSGLSRPLVAADEFQGFADRKADNGAGAASAINVRLRQRGAVVLTVTGGAGSADDVGRTVYASDDDTFTLSSTGNTSIGKIKRWISGTSYVVYFEAASLRSI